MAVCIFCFNRPPPGLECTYGMHHEYPEPEKQAAKQPPKQADVNKCLLCGMHKKNPASLTSSCQHQYPES